MDEITDPVFQAALNHVLTMEGGFVNHPADRGGATNLGITQATLERHLGRKVTIEEMKNLTRSMAAQIYFKDYWQAALIGQIKSEKAAIAVMDQVVNRGVSGGVRLLQQTVGRPVDGKPSIPLMAMVNNMDERHFLVKFISAIQNAYIEIVLRNRSQIVFLRGWLRRSQRLMDFLV